MSNPVNHQDISRLSDLQVCGLRSCIGVLLIDLQCTARLPSSRRRSERAKQAKSEIPFLELDVFQARALERPPTTKEVCQHFGKERCNVKVLSSPATWPVNQAKAHGGHQQQVCAAARMARAEPTGLRCH
ncbi:unnamed protein product [Durusdinium trenchii]|uniref:Uncharacterized protein n=1 Tax=Durusdinium trenchii TaxID=1381693 RepID=A0ABP0LUB4_9DINO